MDKNNKESNWILGIMGIIFILFSLCVILFYFKHVSVEEWLAQENYSNEEEWVKQIGLFIATMAGFYVMVSIGSDFLEYLPKFLFKKSKFKHGKRRTRKKT